MEKNSGQLLRGFMVINKLYYTFYYGNWYPHMWDFLILPWIYSRYVYIQDKCMNIYLYPQVQVNIVIDVI